MSRPGPDRFAFGGWLFLRLLALVHLIAFVSFWTQYAGLIGPLGLEPAAQTFAAVHRQLGSASYHELPSLCWIFGTGRALPLMCAAGVGLSLLLFAGVAPALCLVLLWADYLSLCCAGQIFFYYQWDTLLLETTFLAVFFAPWSLWPGWKRFESPVIARGLLLWLLVRLMLLSGLVKMESGDPTWHHLTALTYHYQTQPLPTPLAWYAHLLPLWFQKGSCAAMFAIELFAPFLLIAPRRFRHPAALLLIALQIAIMLTGNYTFFNWLTIALCLLCFDDGFWRRSPESAPGTARSTPLRMAPRAVLAPVAVFVVFCTATEALCDFYPDFAETPALSFVFRAVMPFRSLNNYGLFARMTTSRPTLVIQGSDDGREWRAYEPRHQAGDVRRAPDFIAPFQPRLDWQLWFAGLESPEENQWVPRLCVHLLHGTPPVLALFGRNPFPDRPPHFIRVVCYDYRFTSRAEKAATGAWWKREVLNFYVPSFSL